MEDSLDFTDINTHLDSIIKKGKEIYESEIALIKNQHQLEVDRMKADFTKEIKQLKQQHQYELVEIRKEINEKPKFTKISSEETTKTSDIK